MSDWRHREIRRLEAIKAGIESEIWQIVADTDRLTRTRIKSADLSAVVKGRWRTIRHLQGLVQRDLEVELRVLKGLPIELWRGADQRTNGRSSRGTSTGSPSRT